jgi:hypothetical protein
MPAESESSGSHSTTKVIRLFEEKAPEEAET